MAKTFKEKLEEKIKEAQKEVIKKQDKALDKLLENDSFIEVQRVVLAKEGELNQLNEIIMQLNSIEPFITNDGRRFSVNVFPISALGIGIGQVAGIITGSRAAFTEDVRMQFCAITGLTSIELYESVEAFGQPAYYKDGKVFDEIKGNFAKLSELMEGIFLRIGLHEYKASDFSQDKYDLYFSISEAKAYRLLTEHDDLQKLEETTQDFVLEA